MLIRMTAGLSGPAYSLGPGDERDFSQDEALRLIAAGYAVPVSEPKVERAAKAPSSERRDFPPPPPDWDNLRAPRRRTERKRG